VGFPARRMAVSPQIPEPSGGYAAWLLRGVDYIRTEAAEFARCERMEMENLKFAAGILLAGAMALTAGAADGPRPVNAKKLDALETQAIQAMKQKAAELNIQGVAVVNYAPGDKVEAWSSKMAVVGRMIDPKASANGNNLLGIAYAKSSEMADTLLDSGTAKRPPMTGEFGWQGGVIGEVKGAHVIVSFSGGKSEDDVQVSKAGLAVMKNGL
jgi:hypothetical protein